MVSGGAVLLLSVIAALWSSGADVVDAFSSSLSSFATVTRYQQNNNSNENIQNTCLWISTPAQTTTASSVSGAAVPPEEQQQQQQQQIPAQPIPAVTQQQEQTSSSSSSSSSTSTTGAPPALLAGTTQGERSTRIRKEGGLFAFDTKFGALNLYGIYYGLVAIALGIPWFMALLSCQIFYFVTRNRFDKQHRIPIFITHIWGTVLMRLSRSFPVFVNRDILDRFYKENRPAMFVANHSSWMDIPYLGALIGWRNYKLIAKKELRKVPILGRAIQVGGHIMVDRTNRRSQLETLKKGMGYLKSNVHLCTYPEGTRTKTGRLGNFKNGAFKMAHKEGAPVIPVSIVNAVKVQPYYWMFPFRSARRGNVQVIVHEPVESIGKTEDELATEVRNAMITGLPPDQRPAVVAA